MDDMRLSKDWRKGINDFVICSQGRYCEMDSTCNYNILHYALYGKPENKVNIAQPTVIFTSCLIMIWRESWLVIDALSW